MLVDSPVAVATEGVENFPLGDRAISAMSASMWLLPKASFESSSLCSLGTVSTASFSHEALSAAGASRGVVRRRGACCVSDLPSVNVTFTARSHRHARELQREELDPRVEPQEP